MARWWEDGATLERLEQIARHKAAQPGAAPIEVQRQIATRALAPRPEYAPPPWEQYAPAPQAQPSRWETYTMTPFQPHPDQSWAMLPAPTLRDYEAPSPWDGLLNTRMPTWLEDYHNRFNDAWAKVTAPREDWQLGEAMRQAWERTQAGLLTNATETISPQGLGLPEGAARAVLGGMASLLGPAQHDIKQVPGMGLVPRVGQAVLESGIAALSVPEEIVEQSLGQMGLSSSQRVAQLMREDPELAATLMGSQFDVGRVWYNLESKGYQPEQIRSALREVSRITYSGPEAAEAAAVRVIHGEDPQVVTWGRAVNVREPKQDDIVAYLRYITSVYESALQQGLDEPNAREIAARAEQELKTSGRIPGEGKILRELVGQIVLDPLNITETAQKLARVPRAVVRATKGLGVVEDVPQAARAAQRVARAAEDLPPMSPFAGATLPPSATGFIADIPEEAATAARAAERAPLTAAAAEFLAERADESRALSRYTSVGPLFSPNVPQNVADVAEGVTSQAERGARAIVDGLTPAGLRGWASRAWKKISPFTVTGPSEARQAVSRSSVVIGTLLSESQDAEDAVDLFKRFITDPQSLAPVIGNLGLWGRSKEARKLLAPFVDGIEELPSIKAALEGGAAFHAGDFLLEIDDLLMKVLAKADATGPKGLIDYQRFADNYRSLMSEFYLRTGGYALRNTSSDLVTLANDGLLTFDGFDTVIGDLTKIGPITPRVERAIRGVGLGLAEEMQMGGKSVLGKIVGRTIGHGAGEAVSNISERIGGFMATGRVGGFRTVFGEESRYLKAIHAGLMKVLAETWRPTIPDDLAQALGPVRTAALQGHLRRALTSEDMVEAVRRVTRGGDVVGLFDYGKYLGDDADSLSIELVRRLDAQLRSVETPQQAAAVFDDLVRQLDDELGRVIAGDPIPPVRSVNSTAERLQDAAEDGATIEKAAIDAGIDPGEAERLAGQHVSDMQQMQGEVATLETTVMEQARASIEAGQDPRSVAAALRGLRVEIGQIQMDTRGAVDKARREVYEQLRSVRNGKLSGRAMSARSQSIWNTYYDDVRRIRGDEQSKIRGMLQSLQTSLAGGQVPEMAPDTVTKAVNRYRSQLEQLTQRRERLGRTAAGEVLNIADDEREFATELEKMRLAFDEAQAEAWRVGLVNPSTDALDVMSQAERDAQHIGAVAAHKAEQIYEQWRATWGRSDEWTKAKFREMVDPIWRQAFADQANRMDLARHELFSLPLGDRASQTLAQTLGWPAEAVQTLSPDALRLVLKDRIPWDAAIGGPIIPVAQLEEWTLEGVARNLGIDLADPRAIDAHDWARIGDLAERDAQLYRALSSEEALFWHIASRGEQGLEGMTAGLRTLRGVRDLTADDPAFIERMRQGAARLEEVAASARARQYVGTRGLGQGIEAIPEGAEYVERARKGDLYQVRVMSHGKLLAQATFDNAAEALRESQRIEGLLSHGAAVPNSWVPVSLDDAMRRFGIDSSDPDDLQRLIETAQGRAADYLAQATRPIDRRRVALFNEMAEELKRYRDLTPEELGLLDRGFLPKGAAPGFELGSKKLPKGAFDYTRTDEWYQFLTTELDDTAALTAMGQEYVQEVLRVAGVSDLELSKLNYRQQLRLVEEIGNGELLTAGSGRVSKIGDMDVARRLKLRDSVTPDVRKLAQGAVADPARALGYEWMRIADEAVARQETLRLLKAGIIQAGDVDDLIADPAARQAMLESMEQMAFEAEQAAAAAVPPAAATTPATPGAPMERIRPPRSVLLEGEPGPVKVVDGFITTPSGRRIQGPPQIRTATERMAVADTRKYDQWLLDQAIEEAKARGDTWNAESFARIKPQKMREGGLYPQADRDLLVDYLFGTKAEQRFEYLTAAELAARQAPPAAAATTPPTTPQARLSTDDIDRVVDLVRQAERQQGALTNPELDELVRITRGAGNLVTKSLDEFLHTRKVSDWMEVRKALDAYFVREMGHEIRMALRALPQQVPSGIFVVTRDGRRFPLAAGLDTWDHGYTISGGKTRTNDIAEIVLGDGTEIWRHPRMRPPALPVLPTAEAAPPPLPAVEAEAATGPDLGEIFGGPGVVATRVPSEKEYADLQLFLDEGIDLKGVRLYATVDSLPPVPEGMVRFYHGTNRVYVPGIVDSGLRPGSEVGNKERLRTILGTVNAPSAFGDVNVVADVPASEVHMLNRQGWAEIGHSIPADQLVGILPGDVQTDNVSRLIEIYTRHKELITALPAEGAAAATPDLSQGPRLFGETDLPIFSGVAPRAEAEVFRPEVIPDVTQAALPEAGVEDAITRSRLAGEGAQAPQANIDIGRVLEDIRSGKESAELDAFYEAVRDTGSGRTFINMNSARETGQASTDEVLRWAKKAYEDLDTPPIAPVTAAPELSDSLLDIFEGDLDPEINEAVHRLAAGGMPVTEAADLGLAALDDPKAREKLLDLAAMQGGMFVDEIVEASKLAGQAVEPPTLADMVDVMIAQQKRLLAQIRDGMVSDWDSLRTVSGEGLLPWVSNRAGRWARSELPKQWAQTRTVAVEAARNMADFALLDYSKRRSVDTWLGMVTPYSYWKTRSARNWAIRLSQQPATLAHYMRYKQAMDRYAKEKGYRSRFRGTVPIPTGNVLPEWMGGELYVNPETLFFPFAEMAPNEWEDPAGAKNGIDYAYRTLGKYGFRPYGFLEAGLKASGVVEDSALPGEGVWHEPLTSTPQGTLIQAARTLTRPEEKGPVDNLIGQLDLHEWDAYRIDRMLSNMSGDDPSITQGATLAQALVERIAMGEFEPREALEGSPNIDRWAEVYAISPEELASAQYLLGVAWLRMQQEKVLPGAISAALPVSGRPFPTGERQQIQMQRESAAAGYDPLTRTGNRAQYEAYMAEHPEAYTRAVSFQMVPGSEPIDEQTWTPLERRGTLMYQPEKQAALEELGQQQLHLLATGGLWNRDPIRSAREEHTQAMTARREELSVGEFAWPKETTTFTPLYGSTPEEGLREAQEEVLGLISNAVPRYANFDSAKEYEKAVKAFYEALSTGDYETAGVTLPANLPQEALDYGSQIQEEDLVKFWQQNDTLAEALVEGFSGWYGEQWDRYYAAKGRDMTDAQLARLTDAQREAYYTKRDRAWEQYVEQNKLAQDNLVKRVMEQYDGRWTPEEIREALSEIKMPTTLETWLARKTPEERAEYEASEKLNDAKQQFWDAYWGLPEDPDWRSTKGQPLVAFIIDKDTRGMATAEQYLAAAAVLRRYLEDFGAEEGEEETEKTTSKTTGTSGKATATARPARRYYGGGGGGSRKPATPQEPQTWDDVRQDVSGALTRQLSDFFLRSKALDPGALREIEALMTKLGWKGTLEAFLEMLRTLFKARPAPTAAPAGKYRYRK